MIAIPPARFLPFLPLLLFFSSMFGSFAYAQERHDRFVMMNGDTLTLQLVEIGPERVSYRKPGKEKVKRFSPERVFSVIRPDGREEYVYVTDTVVDNDFSVEQVKKYIRGVQDGRKYDHAPAITAGAFIVGGGSAILGHFYGLIPPVVFIAIVGSSARPVAKQKGADKRMKDDYFYGEGYMKSVRARKVRNGALAGLAGYITGLVVLQLQYR